MDKDMDIKLIINKDKDNDITKNDLLASALSYNKGDEAPKLVAKGKNEIAQRIIAEAQKNNITVTKNSELANVLNNLELGERIPESLYDIVAQLLLFVGDIDNRVREKLQN